MMNNDDVRFPVLPGEVAVLCGGPGMEREVSLASGESVHEALLDIGLENRLVVVPERNPSRFLEKLDCGVAVMMLHGEFGEDGTAQEILDDRGISYTGSAPDACRLAMDKRRMKTLMREAGVPTAAWVEVEEAGGAEPAVRRAGLRYPLFVKPNYGGSSVGVSRVDAPEALSGAVERALAAGGGPVLVEEMILGREMTAGWLDGRLLPLIEMETDTLFYDYTSKYESETTRYHCPADVDAALLDRIGGYVEQVVGLCGARDLARVDFILGESGPMFLELNALPGFTGHSLLPLAASRAGMGMGRLCLSLVAMAAERAFPRLRVLPTWYADGEEEDESEVIDFHYVDWKRMGV